MVSRRTLLFRVLWHFIGEMYESEQMDFKNRHKTYITKAKPQSCTGEKKLENEITKVNECKISITLS